MRAKLAIVVAAVAGLVGGSLVDARPASPDGQAAASVPGGDPKALLAARDPKTPAQLWMWHMGMLRGEYEVDGVATLEIQKSTGTISVSGQPCTLVNYRASINYQGPGMRVQYTSARDDG